jgi:predicted transposase YbfD/YdcC
MSTALGPERFSAIVRAHWGIENGLHWLLDVAMDEDRARNRKDYGPENLAVLRRLALNLVRREASNGSTRVKLKRTGWSDTFLTKLLTQI